MTCIQSFFFKHMICGFGCDKILVYVSGEFWIFLEHDQADQKCLPLRLVPQFPSIGSLSVSSIFAARCIELDLLPSVLVHETGGRREEGEGS